MEAPEEQQQVCTSCSRPLSLGDFYVRDKVTGKRRRDCKKCVIERDRRRHPPKPPRLKTFDAKTYKAQWYQDNRERLVLANRQWVLTNPKKNRALHSKWQKENLESGRMGAHRYYARKRGNDLRVVTSKDLHHLICLYRGMCSYCQERPFEHWDHVIPLARGGRHAIGNLLPSCRICNQSKGAKLLVEWRRTCSR